MASKYLIQITNVKRSIDGHHVCSGTLRPMGTGPEENKPFMASNGLDKRYPLRFKVNWHGSKPRMPEETCTQLTFGRGERMAIASACKDLVFPDGVEEVLDVKVETVETVDLGGKAPKSCNDCEDCDCGPKLDDIEVPF